MNRARVQCVHFCRTRRLDELGVAWNLRDAREDEAWHGHLKELEDYVKLTGDANCRATYEVPDNKSVLGRWLGKQRRKQRQRTLSPIEKHLVLRFRACRCARAPGIARFRGSVARFPASAEETRMNVMTDYKTGIAS